MTRKLYLPAASALLLALSWLIRPDLSGHGLRAVVAVANTERTERVVLLTSNDGSVHPGEPTTVTWTGYLYQPRASEVYFRVPDGVQARLIVGGISVFDTYARPAEGEWAVSYPTSGFNPVTFEITTIPTRREYFQAGLEWETALGTQLVPAAYLLAGTVDEQLARRAILQSQLSQVVGWLGAVLAALFVGIWAWGRRQVFRSRTALGLALIVLLALSLRLIFLRDYSAQPTADVLGYGSDHRGYHSAALDYVRGQWPPPSPFYVQPGVSLALGALYSVFGLNLRLVQILQMASGALTSVLIFDLARRTFDEQAGWIAAALWAMFPLPIFYEAYFLTHGLEPILGAALLWLWAGTFESPRRPLVWIAAPGLTVGAAAVWRPTFLLPSPFIALSLLRSIQPSWQRRIGGLLVLTIATLLPILPITLHNYRADGRIQLLTSNNDVNLYLGNNRDSTGLGEYSPAYWATHALINQGKTSFFRQTLDDIRNDPGRWAQLMIRKTALYLGDPELPNNVDFYSEGTDISPLLAALPLRFGGMMALAVAGAGLALQKRNKSYWLLVMYGLLQIAVTVVYHVFSRFRAPIYPVLPIFAGCCVSFVVSAIRERRMTQSVIGGTTIAVSGLLIWAMPTVAESVMSRPVLAALPAHAVPFDAPMGDSFTLVGHDPLPVVAPGDPFFITLYWQSNQPISTNLIGTVQLFGGDLKVAQGDQMIGTGSFPDYPTSQWQPGQIVKDTYFARMPVDAPTPLALTLLVAAYDEDTGNRLGETTFGPFPLTRLTPLELPSDVQLINARFDSYLLNAYAIRDGTLTLYWQTSEPTITDAVVFIHLFDAQGNFVAGADSKPRNGLYSTLAWQTGEGIVDDHPLPPAPPGEYTIKIGMYDAATQNRLTVVNASGETMADGALELGSVEIP